MSKPSLRPQALHSRISHLLSHWPSDPVRPASVSVQAYLRSRLSQPSPDQQTQSQSRVQQQKSVDISDASLSALSSLLEDRYARRYPLAPRLRKPASNPDHYDNVIREFEEAPDRDWLGRLGKKLKGLFRFS